jgi:hypothetical protein
MTFEPTKGSLPRRDLFLLPSISILTVLLLMVLAEIVCRTVWPEKLSDECLVIDPVLGNRYKPHCSVMRKNAEGPWVRYEFNECGYRGTVSCGPKPGGTLRIVLMGSSAAFGLDVPYEQHIATQAAPALAQVFRHPVEFQNMGGVGRDWSRNEMVLDEALALKPDAIFYFVMPFDLLRMDRLESIQSPGSAPATAAVMKVGAWTRVRHLVASSRLAYMAQHFLVQDESFLLHAVENYGDPLDVSREPTPALTEKRFTLQDMIISKLADRARAAGVPCFLIAIPNRAEAVMIRSNAHLPHLDAYIFPNRMEDIAQKNHIAYIDLLPYLKKAPNAADLYYPVDGHPTGSFHQLLTRALVDYFRKAGSLSEPIQTAGLN